MKTRLFLPLVLLCGCAWHRTEVETARGPLIPAQVQVIDLLGRPRPVLALRLSLRDEGERTWHCLGDARHIACPPLPEGRYRPTALHLQLPDGPRRIPWNGPALPASALSHTRLEAQVQLGHQRPILHHRIRLSPCATC